MIDVSQFLLIFAVSVGLTLSTVLGFQIYLILREFRKTIEKANKVLDDTGLISESVSKPINMLSNMLIGLKGGKAIADWFQRDNKKKEEKS